jgi:hypothetical protein
MTDRMEYDYDYVKEVVLVSVSALRLSKKAIRMKKGNGSKPKIFQDQLEF